MGIFNKVVNILVLVFALAGVALSFLLFNKREMLVAGWEEMSSAVVQTAKSPWGQSEQDRTHAGSQRLRFRAAERFQQCRQTEESAGRRAENR